MRAMNPVNRLLRRNISSGQIAGYALANLVGLAIVLTGLQFYRDVRSVQDGGESFIPEDYMIISKRVDGLQMGQGGGGDATAFDGGEREDIASQPWAAGVGAFKAADFDVSARLDMGGRSMSTALFLESIPEEYSDITPDGWGYEPGRSAYVPLIVSKDYLTLYNFGFAASRGLPQVSEEVIGLIPLRLSLSGNGRQQWVAARIVGFSSRLNTIAVPGSFMEWANSTFGEGTGDAEAPSRLIVRLKRAGDPEATEYMRAHGYEVAGDRADDGKAMFFLSLLTSVVIGIGVVISGLALFILLLSIYLLLQKNREKIHDLMLLGYKPGSVTRYYVTIVAVVNVAVTVMACGCVWVLSGLWHAQLGVLGGGSAALWPTLLTGVGIIAAVTLVSAVAIRRKVIGAFRLSK